MNLLDVEAKIQTIERISDDNETAHGLEDELYRDVLTAIANGDAEPDAQNLAEAVLRVREIEFARWYA